MYYLSTQNRDSLFNIVWNIEVCAFLKNNYYEKKKEKEQKSLENNLKRKSLEDDASCEHIPAYQPLEQVIEFRGILDIIKKKPFYAIFSDAEDKYKKNAYGKYLSLYVETEKFKKAMTLIGKPKFGLQKNEMIQGIDSPNKKHSVHVSPTKGSGVNDSQKKTVNFENEMDSLQNLDDNAKTMEKIRMMFVDNKKRFKLEYDQKFYEYLVITLVEAMKAQNQKEDIKITDKEDVIRRARASQLKKVEEPKKNLGDVFFGIAQNHIEESVKNHSRKHTITKSIDSKLSKNKQESSQKTDRTTGMYRRNNSKTDLAHIIVQANTPKNERSVHVPI